MKVSIVTVVYNSEQTLERTIKSIIRQTFRDFEYLIVDGQSTDGTLSIIKKYEASIERWISEPDNGLYDAMNKGIDMASGTYIVFMNAGDEFYANDTLSKVLNTSPDADVYYGNTVVTRFDGSVVGERRLKPPKQATWRSLCYGMLISHQAFFAKKRIMPYYDLNYHYSADFDWMIKVLRNAKTIVNTEMTLARFLDGGRTSQTIIPGLKERFRIMAKHYGLLPTTLRHFIIGTKFFYFWIRYGRF